MMTKFRWVMAVLAIIGLLSGCSADSLQNLTLVTPPADQAQSGEVEALPSTDSADPTQSDPQTLTTAEPLLPVSPTTGLSMTNQSGILAVAYDANEQALTGIAQADVVYEFFPDGDVQACLIALFHDRVPEQVMPLGPIYGYAAPYLQSWQIEALYAFGHDATQDEQSRAVTRLAQYGITFEDGAASDSDAFTYLNDAQVCMAALNTTQTGSGKDLQILDYSAAAQPFSRMAYTITMGDWVYRYDQNSGLYFRYVDGSDAKDADGTNLSVQNVIFLRSLYTHKADSAHCDIELSMGGEADIFSQGSCLYGRWTWDEATGKITLLDENHQTVELTPGKTWIHVVTEEAGIDFE